VADVSLRTDPEAAAVVLGVAAPLRMAGLNLTRQFLLDDAFVGELRGAGGRLARFCADAVDFALGRHEAATGVRAAPAHDVCAVLAVTHPHLVEAEARPVVIELHGQHTRGMTVVDERGELAAAGVAGASEPAGGGAAIVEVGYRIDAAAARTVLLEAITAAG